MLRHRHRLYRRTGARIVARWGKKWVQKAQRKVRRRARMIRYWSRHTKDQMTWRELLQDANNDGKLDWIRRDGHIIEMGSERKRCNTKLEFDSSRRRIYGLIGDRKPFKRRGCRHLLRMLKQHLPRSFWRMI